MILAVIPARGGSRGLLRKNLLPIGGVPMVVASARAAQDAGCTVIVSTDDVQIADVAAAAGFEVHWRPDSFAEVPVDEVVSVVCEDYEWEGPVLLVQPTVQPITKAVLEKFCLRGSENDAPTTLVYEDRHMLHDPLRQEWLRPRVNRQDIDVPLLREVGVRWWPSASHIGEEPMHMIVWRSETLVDIDTADDWHAAQPRKTIKFEVLSDTEHGRGHLHRCVTIAERLQRHHIWFDPTWLDEWARDFLAERGWSLEEPAEDPDLIVCDRLDVPRASWPTRVLTLEDANHAGDRTINALYEDGADWAVLRPDFLHGVYDVRDGVQHVMVMFGGTDPSGTGLRIAQLLDDIDWEVDWVRPGDDIPVAQRMRQADILVTSAGRTVFEAAAVGVPTIVLAQNLRETTHTHLGYEHGNVYLGLAQLTTDKQIVDAVDMVADDWQLRCDLSRRGRPDGKGVDRIVHVIDGMLGGL